LSIITLVLFTIGTTVALIITVGLTYLALSMIAGVTVLAFSIITAIVRVVNVLSLLLGIIRDIPNVRVFNTVSG